MKILRLSLFVLLIVLLSYANAMSQSTDETRLLESELALAKKPNIYFIFNLKDREILLKARGVVLRRMKIEDVKFWGTSVDAQVRPLVSKGALFEEPKRVQIDPVKNKEEEENPAPVPVNPATFDIDALELKDMPTSYRLEFSEGIFISVRPAAAGFKSNLFSIASSAGWHISRPALTIWSTIKGRAFTSIYLTLNEEDARSIYWSLVEKSENIIYHP